MLGGFEGALEVQLALSFRLGFRVYGLEFKD